MKVRMADFHAVLARIERERAPAKRVSVSPRLAVAADGEGLAS